MTMKEALYSALIDFGMMSVLIIIGQIMRAKIKLFQKALIPPALIGGFLALIFGPSGLGFLPFSAGFGTYPALLMCLVFAATPIGDRPHKGAMSGRKVGGMFFNITGIAVLQYGVGMLITVYVLKRFFPALHSAFGLMMATGFYGGHSTAAAVGSACADLGIENMTDLGNTCATIGIVGGILLGIVLINWGCRKGYTHYVTSPDELPVELRTGLIPPEKQGAGSRITVSNICIDPLAFHFCLVLIPSVIGYGLSMWFKDFSKAQFGMSITLPDYCIALLIGFIINVGLNRTSAHQYVDRYQISRIMGFCTDFIMVAGVDSLNLKVVAEYAVPIIVVCTAGFVINFLWFIYVGGKVSPEDWFERNMMCWGHATGVSATGVLLQRACDPELKSRGIEDSGISDLVNRPIIIGLQVIPPLMFVSMGAYADHIITWGIMGIVAVLGIIALVLKWWDPKQKLHTYDHAREQ